jgi:hypothetical protein
VYKVTCPGAILPAVAAPIQVKIVNTVKQQVLSNSTSLVTGPTWNCLHNVGNCGGAGLAIVERWASKIYAPVFDDRL